MIYALALIVTMLSPPLQLEWVKPQKSRQSIENYTHYYGETKTGFVVYLGKSHFLGLETEIHLKYQNKKLTSATLLLGPAGLSSTNCISKYKKLTSLMVEKYGPFKYQLIDRDPLIHDLVYSDTCHAVYVGLYSVNTCWSTSTHTICAALFGDDDAYIEVDYVKKSEKMGVETRKKLLQSL